jgi:hypothetical protein
MNRIPVPEVRARSFCVTLRFFRVSRISVPICSGVYLKQDFSKTSRTVTLYLVEGEGQSNITAREYSSRNGGGRLKTFPLGKRRLRQSNNPWVNLGRYPVEWRGLNVQPPLCSRQNSVAHVAVALQPPVIHPREHSDVGIDVIIDFDHTLVIVAPVESSDVLLKRALPRNGQASQLHRRT